jgi:hypothetical protein
MDYFKILSRHSLAQTDGKHENLSQDSGQYDRNSKRAPPEQNSTPVC